MLKVGDLARREDRRVRGVKSGKTLRDREISHVCLSLVLCQHELCNVLRVFTLSKSLLHMFCTYRPIFITPIKPYYGMMPKFLGQVEASPSR